jgi:MEDS: MEthanogen/methylotroph, DcmR Sensory domain
MAPGSDPGRHTDAHSVLFYRDDSELAARAGEPLLAALTGGGTAIVIATPAHRELIGRWLTAAGADLPAAAAAGRYLTRDARETMASLMAGGWPSPAGFWQTINPLIQRAAATAPPVRVFGEIVALLWESAQLGAALELEALWSELTAHYPFGLVCGYSAGTIGGRDRGDALAELCEVHAGALGSAPGPDLGAGAGPAPC